MAIIINNTRHIPNIYNSNSVVLVQVFIHIKNIFNFFFVIPAPAGPSCCSSADSGHHSASCSVSGVAGGDFFRRPSSSSSSNALNQSHQQQNFDHLRLQQQSLIKVGYFTLRGLNYNEKVSN